MKRFQDGLYNIKKYWCFLVIKCDSRQFGRKDESVYGKYQVQSFQGKCKLLEKMLFYTL